MEWLNIRTIEYPIEYRFFLDTRCYKVNTEQNLIPVT